MGRDATGHAALDCRRYRFVVDRHLLRAILARRSRSPGEQPQSLRQSTMLFRRLDTAGCRSNAGAALARPLLRRTQAERSATILLPNSSKREGHSDREVRALSKKLNLRPCTHHITGLAVRRNRFRSANASRFGHDAEQA